MKQKKFKVGQKIKWQSYGKQRTGIIEKIVPKNEKSLKARPDDCHRTLVAINPKNVID